jgi:hypothetical protein
VPVARSKDGSDAVTWIQGDAAGIPEVGADLALMTGNVAQVFLADEEWARALRAIGAALRPRGYRVLDVREAPDRPGREFVFITQRTS